MPTNVVPVAKAVYLCDDVLEDRSSRKIHVVGVFTTIRPPAYPHSLRQLCVFAQLTGGLGESSVRVEIVEAESELVVYTSPERPLHFPGRQTTVSVCFRISDYPCLNPGTHIVELYAGGTFLDDRTLYLLAHEEEEQ